MAYTSIWAVKGWLGKVVIYVENPEKTENPAYFEKSGMTESERQGLDDVIGYAAQSRKTQGTSEEDAHLRHYVSGVNCRPTTARNVMLATKQKYGKNEGVAAYHGVQSFAAGETTPEIAHEIGMKLARKLWGDRFEVLVATHLDRDCLHNHFVVNTVSFADGLRYYRSNQDYAAMQNESDNLCREYNLSVIADPEPGKSKHYSEWNAERKGQPTYRGIVRGDVDDAIKQSFTERQFWENIRKKGYTVKFGQDITLRPAGKERGLKLRRNFGDDYAIERIRERILENTRPQRQTITTQAPPQQNRMLGNLNRTSKITGFRALYFSYLHKMQAFPQQSKRKPNPKQVYFLYREDIRYIQKISDGARLLAKHKIDTPKQLSAHKKALKEQIENLVSDRKQAQKTENHGELSIVNSQLSIARREVRLCEDIETRSKNMTEKIRKETEQKPTKKREVKTDGQFRRGRTNR